MTQKYDENVGARDFSSGTAIQSKSYDIREGNKNRLEDRVVEFVFDTITSTSGDGIISFAAPDDGKLKTVTLVNGTVAADASNGLELEFKNKSNSDDVVAYVGFGSGTEADKATDKDVAVAAQEVAPIKVTDTSTCNKDDNITCVIDRDGTSIVGTIIVEYEVSSEGR